MLAREYVKKIVNRILCFYYKFPKDCLIHYKSKLNNVKCEGKNKICGNVRLNNCELGFGTFVANKSSYSNCRIGRYCAIGGGLQAGGHPLHKIASICPAFYSTTGQYGFTYVKEMKFNEFKYADNKKKYQLIIGNDVWVAIGSKIVEGVTIGDGAIVMTSAVVTKDVPPYAIVAGIPAKIVGYRFNQEQIDFLLKLKWWEKGEDWIKGHAEYFENIEKLMGIIKSEKQSEVAIGVV